LASQANTLYHLGVKPVHCSTLSYANEHRSHELFRKLFEWMLSKCQPLAPKHKFRFKNPLYSIDNTVIDLCLSLFDWAKFRTTKGAVKLHVKLNHSGYLPTFAIVTTGKTHEQKVAPLIHQSLVGPYILCVRFFQPIYFLEEIYGIGLMHHSIHIAMYHHWNG
jgi:hypothetical protein